MNEISQKQVDTNNQNTKLDEVKNKQEKAISKNLTREEKKNLIKESLIVDCEPNRIIQTAAEKITAIASAGKKEREKAEKEFMEIADKSLMPLGLETHYTLSETVYDRYRPLIIEITRQIEKEYDCKTPTEKILAETIAGSHMRIINYSKKLNTLTEERYLSAERNGYGSILSKEIDRAQKHLMIAITTLKQIKNPPIELNIKTKTAFVTQNQQVINANEINSAPKENH